MFLSGHRLNIPSLRNGKYPIVKNIPSLRNVKIPQPYTADFTLNVPALLWELHWTFKATHIVAFFAFFSAAAFAELKCALLKRFLRVQIISILFLDTLQGSLTHCSSSSHMVMIIMHLEAKTVPLIPILEINDPGDHSPLILQPMFVGIFEKYVVLSKLHN